VSAFPFATNNDAPLPQEVIDHFRDLQYWSVWASESALEVGMFSVTDLAKEVAADADYASRIFAIYQMLLVDQANSVARAQFAKQVVERFHRALSAADCLPAGNPLDTAINYAWVPRFHGVHPDDVNILRPDRQQAC